MMLNKVMMNKKIRNNTVENSKTKYEKINNIYVSNSLINILYTCKSTFFGETFNILLLK